uniref:CSON011076 protein n=1 Tax=Culicoides sonorensis TaxID=179676 RepID=A0A336LR60_CULSO
MDNLKVELTGECHGCTSEITNQTFSIELVDIFREFTCIEPLYDINSIVFCTECESLLKKFKDFKLKCVQTQEIFTNRMLQIKTEPILEEEIYCDEFKIDDELKIDKELKIEYEVKSQVKPHFTCDICQKSIRTKKELNNHMISHESPIECEICHVKLKNSKCLKRHVKIHNPDKSFKCSYCEAAFNCRNNQYVHERYVHKTGKQYMCPFCAFITYNPSSMKEHHKRFHSNTRFKCDECSKEFKTSEDLKVHKTIHIQTEKNIPCPECGNLFKLRKRMLAHVRLVHRTPKKHVCDVCSMEFTALQNLKRHQLVHTGERKFACTFCTQSFTQAGALKRHITTHTGIRPFACPHCNHTFAEKFYMKKHANQCLNKTKT